MFLLFHEFANLTVLLAAHYDCCRVSPIGNPILYEIDLFVARHIDVIVANTVSIYDRLRMIILRPYIGTPTRRSKLPYLYPV